MRLTLAEWRRLKNISQEEMANSCNVHVNTYRTWEKKPSEIRLSNAESISKRLGVPFSDIIFMP